MFRHSIIGLCCEMPISGFDRSKGKGFGNTSFGSYREDDVFQFLKYAL